MTDCPKCSADHYCAKCADKYWENKRRQKRFEEMMKNTQEDTPIEFNKILKDNFWDLLA